MIAREYLARSYKFENCCWSLKFTESELYIKVTFNVAVIFNVKVPFRLPKNFQNSPKCQQNDQDKIDAGNLDAVDYISTVALYLHQSSTISTEMV